MVRINTIKYLSVLCLIWIFHTSQALADSYKVWVNGGPLKDFVGYNYASAPLNTAIPTAPDGTIVWLWNKTSQAYEVAEHLLGFGWYPNLQVEQGTSFFITTYAPAGWLTIHGTEITSTSYSMSLETNKLYFLASAYKLSLEGGNFLECMGNVPQPYVHNSLRYSASIGDTVHIWDWSHQVWNVYTRTLDGYNNPKWDGLSPNISPHIFQNNATFSSPSDPDIMYGGGFVLEPAENKTWTHLAPSEAHGCN